MKQHIKTYLRRGLAVVCVAAALAGCNRGIPSVTDTKEVKTYTMPEMMLVVANERNRYEQIYTSQVWDVAVDESGTTFKQHLLAEVKSFLEDLRTMNLLAEEKEITLTEQEKETLRQLAREYYNTLTEQDRAYIQAEQEDIYNMYAQYHLANKVVSELIKDVDLEVSDNEAKVITVMQIRIDDANAAWEAHDKLLTEGADFAAVARSYTKDGEITVQIGRGEQEANYEKAAFALAVDEISDVIQSGDSYYIMKCVSDYDEEETLERKQKLSLQRRSEAFAQIYDEFAGEHQVKFPADLFAGVSFSPQDGTTTGNFFQLYQDYMKNQP